MLYDLLYPGVRWTLTKFISRLQKHPETEHLSSWSPLLAGSGPYHCYEKCCSDICLLSINETGSNLGSCREGELFAVLDRGVMTVSFWIVTGVFWRECESFLPAVTGRSNCGLISHRMEKLAMEAMDQQSRTVICRHTSDHNAFKQPNTSQSGTFAARERIICHVCRASERMVAELSWFI